jgi:hypothetical protein
VLFCAQKRCYAPNHKSYPIYGGRGIIVCDEWVNSFETFYDYVGEPPSDIHTIDRIETNGNYQPGNVKWSTPTEQANNRRNNINITYNEETHTLKQWADKIILHEDTLWRRLNSGWSIEKALTTPNRNIERNLQSGH